MNRRLPLFARAFLFVALFASFGASSSVLAQAGAPPFRIGYTMSLRRPETHLFEVQIEVETSGAEEFVEFQMPRWSPGRYAVFDFAKNVQEFRAAAGCPPAVKCEAAALAVTRADTQTWRVETRGAKFVRASYKVFGDDLSGTFSQFDARHANWNGASVFMYVVGHKPDPVTLRVEAPEKWRVVNGRTTRANQREFEFPNYDVLIDTPTEAAPDWTLDEFKVDGKTYRVVVHSFGGEGGRRGELVRRIERVVRAQTAMWGAPDFESYTFLIHFDPTAPRGDGMEHLNSTQLVGTRALADEGALEDTLGGASHEFFHVWNVKRLRPAGLGPWDFTRPVNTRGLWIAEGFTNYYGTLMLHRAGLMSEAETLDAFAGTVGRIERAPGNRLMSAEESSLLASLIDWTPHFQRVNLQNTAVSYYPKGETLGLVLDLLIRGRSRGRASLDEVMRRAYEEFYVRGTNDSYYLRGRAYTNEEFVALASRVAGFDLSDFHARYARDTQTPPYDEAFAYVGLRLVRRPPNGGGPPDKFTYRLENIKDAPPEARALRAAWLRGELSK